MCSETSVVREQAHIERDVAYGTPVEQPVVGFYELSRRSTGPRSSERS